MNSSIGLIQYFGDDRQDKEKMVKLNNKYFYHEHSVNFSIAQYFETFIIHGASLVVLGPLINVYTLIFYKKAP